MARQRTVVDAFLAAARGGGFEALVAVLDPDIVLRADTAAGPVLAIPVRIVRAAQFHEFVAQLLQWGTQGDVAYVPEMRTQIVSARTVAEVVADVATSQGDPAQIVQIAGPREEDLAQLAAILLGRRGTPVKVQAVRNPADPDADMQATGGLLPAWGHGWPARRSRTGSTSSSGNALWPYRHARPQQAKLAGFSSRTHHERF